MEFVPYFCWRCQDSCLARWILDPRTSKIWSLLSSWRISECKATGGNQIEQAGEHSWAVAPTTVLLQAGIQDTTSPPPLTPPNHALYLAKGQPAPSPMGTLFGSVAFTLASALYRSQDKATPASRDQLPISLLPEPPRLSFTIPEPASQIKPATTDPTLPESPTPAAGSAPPSPSQSGEPFVLNLDVSPYSTDYA